MSGPDNERPRVLVLLGTTYFPPFIDQLGDLHRPASPLAPGSSIFRAS